MHFAHPSYPNGKTAACMTIRRNRGPVFGIQTTTDVQQVTCGSCIRTEAFQTANEARNKVSRQAHGYTPALTPKV